MPDQEVEEHCKDLAVIKEWLLKQPHLPNDVAEVLLRRFLACCNYSLERAKTTLDLFFTIRSTAPEIFCRRDPLAPEIQRVFQITDMIPLPNKTKENYKVFIYRLNNPNMDLFNFLDAVKTFLMLADARLTGEDDVPSGEIPIFDSANVSLKFLTKVNLSVLRKYMLYTQEALPIRLKQIHVINAPSYINKLHAVVKPFLKSEVSKLIQFHEPNSETLYQNVPRELLPDEYGGQAGSLQDLKQQWIQRIVSRRDWFMDDRRWAVDESLRPTGCEDERVDRPKDLPGSFRALAVD